MRSIIRYCQMKRLKQESIIQLQEIERQQQQGLYNPVSDIKMESTNESSMDFKYSPNQGLEDDQKLDVRNGNSNVNAITDHFMHQQEQYLMDGENNVQQLQGSEHASAEAFRQTGIKSEPMDYEQSSTNDLGGKLFTSTSVRNKTCWQNPNASLKHLLYRFIA